MLSHAKLIYTPNTIKSTIKHLFSIFFLLPCVWFIFPLSTITLFPPFYFSAFCAVLYMLFVLNSDISFQFTLIFLSFYFEKICKLRLCKYQTESIRKEIRIPTAKKKTEENERNTIYDYKYLWFKFYSSYKHTFTGYMAQLQPFQIPFLFIFYVIFFFILTLLSSCWFIHCDNKE